MIMARKEIVKAKPRNERVTAYVHSTLVGIKPQETNITCWVPHFSFLNLLKKYNALLARYAKLRKQQQAAMVYVVYELDDELFSYMRCGFTDEAKAISYMKKLQVELFITTLSAEEYADDVYDYTLSKFNLPYSSIEEFIDKFKQLSLEIQQESVHTNWYSPFRISKLELK